MSESFWWHYTESAQLRRGTVMQSSNPEGQLFIAKPVIIMESDRNRYEALGSAIGLAAIADMPDDIMEILDTESEEITELPEPNIVGRIIHFVKEAHEVASNVNFYVDHESDATVVKRILDYAGVEYPEILNTIANEDNGEGYGLYL